MFFLSLQYFRTIMMKNNVLKSFAAGPVSIGPNIIKNVWIVLYYILATNLAVTLSLNSNFHFRILRNISPISFITGDQPVTNTLAGYSVYEEEAKKLELYYPLNSSLALLITNSNNRNSNESHLMFKKMK